MITSYALLLLLQIYTLISEFILARAKHVVFVKFASICHDVKMTANWSILEGKNSTLFFQ
jgi:hypothetical protein